jgi:hypothetical protein
MAEFNLVDVVNLIRSEIARTEVGDVKRIVGPVGPQGPMGEAGLQGATGPRGNDGKPGPQGAKGNQGKKGDKGVKGSDGEDGVGIARVEQDIDNAIVVYLTDGNSYTIEMPIIDAEGNLAKEVHYKSGGGGSGIVDLSSYVRRPTNTYDGKWLLYRETAGTNQGEWSPATTDAIETNGQLMFRDAKGRFKPTPEELENIDNQLKANRFMWEKIQQLDVDKNGIDISPNPPEPPDGETMVDGAFWFDNSEDVMQLFIWHSDSDAWIPVAPPITLDDRVSQGEETQRIIINQINAALVEQNHIKDKISALEGAVGDHSLVFTMLNANVREGEFNLKNGAMELTNTLSSAEYITLSSTDRNGNSVDLDRITEGDVLRLSDIGGQVSELKIDSATNGVFAFTKISGELDRLSDYPYDFVLLSSFDPSGLATIDYVDERDDTKLSTAGGKMNGLIDMGAQRIVNLGEATDDSHAVTRGYVDDKTKEAGGGKPPRPYAQPVQLVLWRYTEKAKEELNSNEFSIKISGEAIEIFLSPHINGQFYIPGKTYNFSHLIGEAYATINEHDGSNVLGFKGTKWWFIQKRTVNGKTTYHNALNGIYYKPGLDTHPLVVGRYYALNFPSPFPFFYYSKDAFLNGTPESASSYALDEDGNEMVPDDAPDMGEVMP